MYDGRDIVCLMIITFTGLFTRIWLIWNPPNVVFDEVHFGNFTNWYIQQKFFFDIHPPLGKLVMAGVAKLAQYPGTIEFNPKDEYPDNATSFVSLRLTPAIFQSFCFPLIYVTLRELRFMCVTSLSASIALCFETSLLAEGRFILSDGMLHFFSCLAIFCLVRFLRDEKNQKKLLLSGLTLGAAISCKNTALGLIGLAGVTQLFWIYKERPDLSDIIKRACGFLIPAISVFYVSYVIHFILLPYNGQGTGYLDLEHRMNLLDNSTYRGRRVQGASMLERVIRLNVIMHTGNMKITKPHPWQSLPIHWPLLRDKWVMFWSDTHGKLVICMGSPLIYWGSFISVLVSVIVIIVSRDLRLAFLVLGWALSYAPFMLIPRSMYLYHYLIPLIFAVMNMTALVECMFSKYHASKIVTLIALISFISYAFFYPVIYGTECDDPLRLRQWSKRWNEGPPPKNVRASHEFTNTTLLTGSLPL